MAVMMKKLLVVALIGLAMLHPTRPETVVYVRLPTAITMIVER